MLDAYLQHVAEREKLCIPPKPLSPEQVAELVHMLQRSENAANELLLDLITNCVPPGVDQAAYVKAGFLSSLARGEEACVLVDREHAIRLLGNMHGGYNIGTLIQLLDDPEYGYSAARELKKTLLVFDAFHDVATCAKITGKGSGS